MYDIKYPVYRKFKNGKEFHKINSENESLSILVRKNLTRLRYSKNAMHVADAMDEEISTESTREEWEKTVWRNPVELNKSKSVAIITAAGYSKDPSIMPEGIMLTLPVQFFEDRATTTDQFKVLFERIMADEETYWNFRLTNLPKHDVAYVYLVFDKHVQYRANLVCYERNKTKRFKDAPDQKVRDFPNANWVLFTGPIIKPPYVWPQKGFQGFRYTTKLF